MAWRGKCVQAKILADTEAEWLTGCPLWQRAGELHMNIVQDQRGIDELQRFRTSADGLVQGIVGQHLTRPVRTKRERYPSAITM